LDEVKNQLASKARNFSSARKQLESKKRHTRQDRIQSHQIHREKQHARIKNQTTHARSQSWLSPQLSEDSRTNLTVALVKSQNKSRYSNQSPATGKNRNEPFCLRRTPALVRSLKSDRSSLRIRQAQWNEFSHHGQNNMEEPHANTKDESREREGLSDPAATPRRMKPANADPAAPRTPVPAH
jgi:hypothetical protein